MPTKKSAEFILYGFLMIATLVNLVQTGITELLFDEAYYWYFSENLSWGYFDHPPMTAFMVWLGRLFSEAETGIRLLAPFLYSATVFLIWKLFDDERKYKYIWLFVFFISSQALLAAYGFFMVPDTPLLFFAALFLYGYKRFLQTEDRIAVICLAIAMAGVMYSKYHGVLLIGLVILSNLKILGKSKFWAAIALSLALYLPHLWWLIENDFAPVRYHLIERANNRYKVEYTLHYLLNCIAIGGLSFPLVYWAFFKKPGKEAFDRALRFLGYGVFVFFLISSFSRRTQAQWVNLLYFPLIYFGFRYAYDHLRYRKWLWRTSLAAVIILFYVRLAIAFPALSFFPFETHHNKEWTGELKAQAGELPVIFHNSYRDASMYGYYAQAEAVSFNDMHFRKNQYDLDSSEFALQGREVVLLSRRVSLDSMIGVKRDFRNAIWKGPVITNFKSHKKIQFVTESKEVEGSNGSLPESFEAVVSNPYDRPVNLSDLKIQLVALNQYQTPLRSIPVSLEGDSILNPGESKSFTLLPKVSSVPEETAFLRFGIAELGFPAGFQGNLIKYTVR